jgi:hypothetical protein
MHINANVAIQFLTLIIYTVSAAISRVQFNYYLPVSIPGNFRRKQMRLLRGTTNDVESTDLPLLLYYYDDVYLLQTVL